MQWVVLHVGILCKQQYRLQLSAEQIVKKLAGIPGKQQHRLQFSAEQKLGLLSGSAEWCAVQQSHCVACQLWAQ